MIKQTTEKIGYTFKSNEDELISSKKKNQGKYSKEKLLEGGKVCVKKTKKNWNIRDAPVVSI